jgi:hypothetical protein
VLTTVLGWIDTIWGAGNERNWQYQLAYWLNEIADYCVDLLYKVEVNYGILHNAEYGNENLAQRIATVEGKIDTLLSRPAGTSGSPVSIGTTGADAGAAAVWSYELGDAHTTGEHLRWAGAYGWWAFQSAIPFPRGPGFKIYFYIVPPAGSYALGNPPRPDWDDIRPDDTRLSWLQRTELAHTWQQSEYVPTPWATWHTYDYSVIYLDLTEAEFEAMKSAPVPTLQSIPPYPGAAYVTLGTSVPFNDSAKVDAATYGVDGKMDGVIILADVVPADQGLRHVQDVYNYYRLGWLVFEDEDANCDRVQALGPHRSVFTPCQFRSPVAVTVSCRAGVSGTITPWIATP